MLSELHDRAPTLSELVHAGILREIPKELAHELRERGAIDESESLTPQR